MVMNKLIFKSIVKSQTVQRSFAKSFLPKKLKPQTAPSFINLPNRVNQESNIKTQEEPEVEEVQSDKDYSKSTYRKQKNEELQFAIDLENQPKQAIPDYLNKNLEELKRQRSIDVNQLSEVIGVFGKLYLSKQFSKQQS